MQSSGIEMMEMLAASNSSGGAVGNFGNTVSFEQKSEFEKMLNTTVDKTSVISDKMTKLINYVEGKFNESSLEVARSIKNFEETGAAVALMSASHEGANKSVMVQLCGTVGKKCSDHAEQLYKQQ